MSTFALDLAKFAEKAKERADEAVGNIVFRIAAELDKRSPVGDPTTWKTPAPEGYVGGHFRANWQLGISSMPSGEVPGVDRSRKSETGGETTAMIGARIPVEAAGLQYFLVNNVPYAARLEYEGWSHQAEPGFIVGGTVLMFKQIVEETIAEAKP